MLGCFATIKFHTVSSSATESEGRDDLEISLTPLGGVNRRRYLFRNLKSAKTESVSPREGVGYVSRAILNVSFFFHKPVL